jgi:hypothetical protein
MSKLQGPAEAGRIYNPPRIVLVKRLAECNSAIQQIENLRYGALLLRELQFAGAGGHFDAVAGVEFAEEELRGQRVQRSSAELVPTCTSSRYAEKRQGTAALQDASAFFGTLLLPQGFGVRLSSAAFIALIRAGKH